MCYSAQIRAEYKLYTREFGATLSIEDYVRKFWSKNGDEWIKRLGGFRSWFEQPSTPEEQRIHDAIADWQARQVAEVEQELFKQTRRVADNERKLLAKVTKTAQEEVRKGTGKVEAAKAQLTELKRSGVRDAVRIYPQGLAPVMVWEDGRYVVKFMRYQCRIPGRPSSSDWVTDKSTGRKRLSGTYNARRDNLERYWRGQFGHQHGIVLADSFFEHVDLHDLEGRPLRAGEKPTDVILEFTPDYGKFMHVACLWAYWSGEEAGEPDEPDLLSFAAVTDEPPAEVAAAGHDRCIIPIKPENVDAWLRPNPKNLTALHAILDDRERPYYEHRMAA